MEEELVVVEGKSRGPCMTQWEEFLLQSKDLTGLFACFSCKAVGRVRGIRTTCVLKVSRWNRTPSAGLPSHLDPSPGPVGTYQGDLDCRSGSLRFKKMQEGNPEICFSFMFKK